MKTTIPNVDVKAAHRKNNHHVNNTQVNWLLLIVLIILASFFAWGYQVVKEELHIKQRPVRAPA